MDGQNFDNNLNNDQNVEPTPVAEPVVEPVVETVSVDTGSYQDSTASTGSYSYQDSTASTGSYNYQDNTASAGSYNYQDNTAQYNAPVYSESGNSQGESTPGLAIASLVMGIVSILICCCWGGGIVLSIPGLIMGISANKKQKTGVGTAGMICSIVGIVLNIIALIYYVVIFMAAYASA